MKILYLTLLNRAHGTSQEPAKTNLNSTNQVSLSGRLNNSDLKPKTLLDQNVQQNNHLPKKSDEFSRWTIIAGSLSNDVGK